MTTSLDELTAEQRDLRALARDVAEREIAPHAATWDRVPLALLRQLGELGLMGVCAPVEHGGVGADRLAYVLVLEELSRADAGVGVTVAVHTGAGILPVLAHGTPEQVERIVPPLAQGHELAAFAWTEPDAAGPGVRSEGGVLHGTLRRIANGAYARHVTVVAREGEQVSAFVTRAFRAVREGSSATADLVFDASPAQRLGEPGAGMRIVRATLEDGRIGIAAQAVGIAQAARDLADEGSACEPEIAAARALVWRAARLQDAGRPHGVEAVQAQRSALRVARHWTGAAIRALGGSAATAEGPRSELRRLAIARALLDDVDRP